MKHNKIQDLFLTITLMMSLTIMGSNKVAAQVQHIETVSQFGFEASAGIQSFQLSSNLYALNQLHINQQGGSIGMNFGNDYWQAKIKPIGFYHSSQNSQATLKLIESGAHVNFYPLMILLSKPSRLPNLYFTGGVVRAKTKINGSYLPEGQTFDCIYGDETFSGSILSWNLIGGAGLEYKIPYDQGSIRFFAEIKKGFSAGASSNQDLFKNTSLKNFTMVNIGFAIGINQ